MKHPDPPHSESVVDISKGRSLAYAEYGDVDGDVIFWLHGTPGGRRQIPPGIHRAGKKHRFRVLAVERPGTGRSSDHRYARLVEFGADMGMFADRLGIDSFGVVGLSGGGPYTLAVAHEHPDRVVAAGVLGGLAPTVGAESQFSYHVLTRLAQPLLEAARRTVVPMMDFGLAAFEAVADPAYHLYVKVNGGADADVMVEPEVKAMFLADILGAEAIRSPIHDLALFGRHWGFRIANVKAPVLIWHGDADHIVPYSQGEHLARLLPTSSLTTVPDLGHFAGFTQADEVLGGLRQVFDGVHPEVSPTMKVAT